MRSEDACECRTDTAHALQAFQISEGTEGIAIGDDASRECRSDAWKPFDVGGRGDIQIYMEIDVCGGRVMRFAGAARQFDECRWLLDGRRALR